MPAQYADPNVSRTKFDREIADYRKLENQYRARGWLMTHAMFPRVSLVLAAPKLKPPAIVIGVEFDYTNYDAAPPSVKMVNPFTGEPYKMKDLPTPLNRAMPQQTSQIPGLPAGARVMLNVVQAYMQAYGPEEIPFLCLAGVREYHDHPAHSGDVWELHRASGAGRLVRLLEVIHRYGIEPIASYEVQLLPQVGFNFGSPPA